MSPSDTSYFESLLPFYKQLVEKVLLPFWSRAFDHQNGGIYTCFDNSGRNLISRDKYTWSPGRFLWAWSKVAAMTDENRLEGDSGCSTSGEGSLSYFKKFAIDDGYA